MGDSPSLIIPDDMVFKGQLYSALVHNICQRESAEAVWTKSCSFSQRVDVAYCIGLTQFKCCFCGIEIDLAQSESHPPDFAPDTSRTRPYSIVYILSQVKSRIRHFLNGSVRASWGNQYTTVRIFGG